MPSPFPGMDPYLEHPALWSEFHDRLILAIAIAIAPQLRPKYRVAIEKRTYLDDTLSLKIPDVAVIESKPEVSQHVQTATTSTSGRALTVTIPMPEEFRERYLEIREVSTGRVITVIELLSPKNKRAGKGRDAYEEKRMGIFSSRTHLIEIDLLRAGKSMQVLEQVPFGDYQILIARQEQRPKADLHTFNLQHQIPVFLVPLQPEDEEPSLNLKILIDEVYDQAVFDLAIDYTQATVPL
ncbi:MAG: DUF4058 family protein, partial [Cyanobacteria bacterium J06626_18]